MPRTKFLGLPLWGETPPVGATGLHLRNAILGENEDSMAQLLDAQVERLANRVTEISDNVTNEQYPSARAMKDYVDENGAKAILEDGKVKDECLPDNLVTENELVMNVTVLLASAGLIVPVAVEDDVLLTENEDYVYIL